MASFSTDPKPFDNAIDWALVGDIGGTNARFALADVRATKPILHAEKSLRTSEYASLQHAAEAYLSAHNIKLKRAAIAVAAPVTDDAIHLTNRAWSFSQAELKAALNLDSLNILNDFGAVAFAVPALDESEREFLYGPQRALQSPITVLGPGTGLGMAMLHQDSAQRWNVQETEGGHVSFAPLSDEEQLIARWLNARFGRTSNERLLCGAGLSHIDAALAGVDHPSLQAGAETLREPADIVQLALDGHDISARRTLARFCAVLGSVCGDAALMHGSRTLMIAGGIVPRFIPFLKSSGFRERFLSKGRFVAYLENVSIYVITHPNPGLLGAAVSLQNRDL
jgi:glucokinase